MSDELHLILGCFGRRDDNFVSCPSVENSILKLDVSLYRYNDMMDYLDGCRMFDRPIYDYNGIRNVLFHFKQHYDQPTRPLWSEKKWTLYQKFTIDHRHCGLYLKLLLLPKEQNSPEIEDKVLITGTEKPKLKIVKAGV